MITDADIRYQVEQFLWADPGSATDFDIDGIVREIVQTYGLVSIDTIDDGEWVAILVRHCTDTEETPS